VGGATHCSHGAGNGLLLPYVMRFNLPARRERFATIARLLGEQAVPEKAIEAVVKLRADIGIPNRLRELGVQVQQLRGFAEKAFGITRILRVNPRTVTQEDLEKILQEAW
jgi:alcohol dehydrogenase class IV